MNRSEPANLYFDCEYDRTPMRISLDRATGVAVFGIGACLEDPSREVRLSKADATELLDALRKFLG